MSNSIKYDSQLILNKLIEVINESGLSYGEIAKRTGIPKSSIHRYVNGQTKKIPIDAVRLIAEATGVSTSYIMGRDNIKSKQQETPTADSDEILMFALYGADNKDITPGMLEDVRNFAQYIREKRKGENK